MLIRTPGGRLGMSIVGADGATVATLGDDVITNRGTSGGGGGMLVRAADVAAGGGGATRIGTGL